MTNEEIRKKLWCDVVARVSANYPAVVAIEYADRLLNSFDERWPDPQKAIENDVTVFQNPFGRDDNGSLSQ